MGNIIAIVLLLIIICVLYSSSEHMGLDEVLKQHVLVNTGSIPYVGPTEHENAAHARLTKHTRTITPSFPTQARGRKTAGVSEHMDDSMGERGEDALEVSLKGGSGWSVFYG